MVQRLVISVMPGEADCKTQSEATYDMEEDLSAQDLVDFSPVYRCLHIHTVLASWINILKLWVTYLSIF